MIDLKKLREHLDTPECQERMDKYAQKIVNNRKIAILQIARAYKKYDSIFVELVEKIIDKYNTKQYINRWRSRGYEPPERLLYFILDYVRNYGEEVDSIKEIKKYGNMFTTELYKYKGYYIGLMQGQGSTVIITKETE